MGLLAPWFLAGLAAIGLPVWLHLLRKHRTTPVTFSSLMFFERRIQSSIKHRRLEHLLLFALRVALIVLLALAFAQPFLSRGIVGVAANRMRVLAIDDSFSMREGGRLAEAKRAALAELAGGRPAQVVSFSGQAQVLTQGAVDTASARAAVQTIEASDSRSSYGDLVRALRVLAASARQPLDVHVFSDFQKSSMPAAFADLRMPAGAALTLHPVEGAARNWTVEAVRAPRRVYEAKNVRVEAVVAGHDTPEAMRHVSLALNGRVVASQDAKVPANGRTQVEFTVTDVPHGFARGEVRIDAADGLAADDRFNFTIERSDPKPVLFVRNPGEERGLTYFRAALEASAQAAFRVEDAPGGSDLSRYGFVVLSDPATIPADFEQRLRNYVRAGGAVWVALGPSSAAARRVPLIASRAVENRYYAGEQQRFETVAAFDAAHPSFARVGNWAGVKFYDVVRFEAPEMKVIARLEDQTPVLAEVSIGEGRVLVFASAFDNISNDFPLHASFVPFVEQTALYLSGMEEGASSVPVDSYLELRAARDHGAAVEVNGPGGGRELTLEEAAAARTFPLARTGFYEVRRANGRHELVAVNADRRESDLARAAEDTLAMWRKTGGEPGGAGAGQQQTARRSLWWFVLAAALALAAAESVVGNRHLAASREEAARKEVAA
jgi:hypothetical protein